MSDDPRFAPTTLGKHVRERELDWFCVTEAWHEPGEQLDPHAHRYPAITIVRRGSFGLDLGKDAVDCTKQGAIFKRGEQRHANRVGEAGALFLVVELRTDESRVEARDLPLPDRSGWTGGEQARRLAERVDSEWRAEDVASNLALEGLVLELVAQFLREGTVPGPDRVRPAWLDEVEELLRSRFRDRIGLGDLATMVGRHPAHVARTFRSFHGCSPGEFVRRVRLEHAAECLRFTDRPLGEIALEAGFYDQAHFGRLFRQWSSRSPGAYRRCSRE